MTDQRRGSGYSMSINRGAQQPTDKFERFGNPMAYPGYGPPVSPYFMQSPPYPVLMNPPPLPTYYYGIPPSPMTMGGGGYPMMQATPSMKRAGSVNARLMIQDARRPFSKAGPPSEADYGIHVADEDFHYDSAKPPTDAGFDHGTIEEEHQSALEALQQSQQQKQAGFMEKLKFWETSRSKPAAGQPEIETPGSTLKRSYSIRKNEKPELGPEDVMAPEGRDLPPYPGVLIEEMMESASMHNGQVAPNNVETASSVLGPEQFSAELAIPQRAPVRWKHTTPINTVVMFVPQQEAWIVERMGKFHRILEPGLNVLAPVVDKVKYVQSLKELAIDIPQQTAITIDNVILNIDGILYLRVFDAYKASYGVEDPEFAITQLAQTTMRSEIGRISLDTLFRERDNLNKNIVRDINGASEAWGISCLRYEIRDVRMPARVQEAMQMQVEAERKKRAAILESEGIRSAEINVAEGKKQARILSSEAERQELINSAQGAAEAVVAAGRARAQSIELVSKALADTNGHNAAALAVAEKYVSAFAELARTNNTLILPANTGDVSNMVAQAMSIYGQLQNKPSPPSIQEVERKALSAVAEEPEVESVIDAIAESRIHSDKPQEK